MAFNLEKGVIEEKAIPYLKNLGYNVTISNDNKSQLIIKRNTEKRVVVRSTYNKQNSGKYALNLSHNIRGGLFPFDKKDCDMILAYIIPTKEFKMIYTSDIKGSNLTTLYI